MKSHSSIGRRVPRVDGLQLVTGGALYTADVALPRMLHGRILRSPHAHARVLCVDAERAKRVRGVMAVITGKDTAGRLFGIFPDERAVAVDRVRYIGEAVAAVAALDDDIAEEALSLISVEYEPLPAVFDPSEAMRLGAPLVHEGLAPIHIKEGGESKLASNVSFVNEFHVGDVERAFAEADHVREDTFTTSAQCHCALEPHGAVADFDAGGKLTLWSSTQGPFLLARDLAFTLDMSPSDIRIIKPRVGGAFGGKREMMASDFCAALLSRRAHRPVKIIYTREEEFMATRARHPMTLQVKTGVRRDGTLVAQEMTIIADGGAYSSRGPVILKYAGGQLGSLYRVPNIKFAGYHVYTNNPVSGSFRGFGMLQARFAIESQMDLLAEDLGIDPAEIRLKNAVRAGEVTSGGRRVTSCGLSECIEKVVEASGWRDRRVNLPPNHGLGIACNDYVSSGARSQGFIDSSAAYVRLQDDGTVVLFVGAADIGQGSDTTLCQIAAEELGVPVASIRIVSADTELAPRDMGTYASRITFVAGNAVKLAAADARRQLFQVAADCLEARPEDLEARDGRVFVKGSPDRGLSFQEAAVYVMKERGVHVQGRGGFAAKVEDGDAVLSVPPPYSFGAQVAEVEVDTETGQVKVRRFVAAHDCGFAINPMGLEGQVEGSVVCGMGHALVENRLLDEGRVLNPSLLDYKIPTSLEAPYVAASAIETKDPEGPFGAKGVSEGAQVPVAPAIANAIYDAIGVRINDLPITPEKILKALHRSPKD
ncbi:MAG: molybdopterin-dependent oxidoreductase [Chloroflexi bacterium]|nr:molybdopterin-dependent oxidoreductase [Chloroflexota bacterium]